MPDKLNRTGQESRSTRFYLRFVKTPRPTSIGLYLLDNAASLSIFPPPIRRLWLCPLEVQRCLSC